MFSSHISLYHLLATINGKSDHDLRSNDGKSRKGEGEPKGPDATTMKTKIGRKANAYTSKCAMKTKTSKSCHGKNKDCVQTQFDYVCGSERCSLHT